MDQAKTAANQIHFSPGPLIDFRSQLRAKDIP